MSRLAEKRAFTKRSVLTKIRKSSPSPGKNKSSPPPGKRESSPSPGKYRLPVPAPAGNGRPGSEWTRRKKTEWTRRKRERSKSRKNNIIPIVVAGQEQGSDCNWAWAVVILLTVAAAIAICYFGFFHGKYTVTPVKSGSAAAGKEHDTDTGTNEGPEGQPDPKNGIKIEFKPVINVGKDGKITKPTVSTATQVPEQEPAKEKTCCDILVGLPGNLLSKACGSFNPVKNVTESMGLVGKATRFLFFKPLWGLTYSVAKGSLGFCTCCGKATSAAAAAAGHEDVADGVKEMTPTKETVGEIYDPDLDADGMDTVLGCFTTLGIFTLLFTHPEMSYFDNLSSGFNDVANWFRGTGVRITNFFQAGGGAIHSLMEAGTAKLVLVDKGAKTITTAAGTAGDAVDAVHTGLKDTRDGVNEFMCAPYHASWWLWKKFGYQKPNDYCVGY